MDWNRERLVRAIDNIQQGRNVRAFNPRMQRIPGKEDIARMRRKKRELKGDPGDQSSSDSDRASEPVPDDSDPPPQQKTFARIPPQQKRLSIATAIAASQKVQELERTLAPMMNDMALMDAESAADLALSSLGTKSPLTPLAMTHFAPPQLEVAPVMRRSFLTPEQTQILMAQHILRYPPNAFQIPYLSRPVQGTSGGPLAAMTGDEDISPLHMAAGTGNEKLLLAALPVFDINCRDREGRTPLVYAVIGDDLAIIQLLHQHKANLDCTDFEGRTAVHWAAYYGRHVILKLLVKYGANWRIYDNEGRTALHWSTGNDDTNSLEVLLDKATRFEINEPDSEQMTPLHWAVFHNHPKHMKKILKHGANVTLTDVEGKTPLHWCAPHKDVVCAKMLLKYDPSVISIADLDGRTALHLACAENNSALVEMLASSPSCDINAHDLTMRTSLHWATVSGHHHLVYLLLENGASDSVKDRVGASPLHYACSKNHAQCVAALFSSPNPSYLADNEGRHALLWAVSKGHVQSVRILLEKKVDPNYTDNQQSTALHAAAHAGQTHCVSLLLEHGATVDCLDSVNHTPLFRAVERGYAETANMLIQARSNVNHLDKEGRSPLHWAALFGHLPVLSLLLANDAVVDQEDKYGKSPMHCGAYNGHNEVVKYLIECGANVNHVDKEGLTPLHWSAFMGNSHTVELLLIEGAQKNPTDKSYTIPTPLDYAMVEGHTASANILVQFGAKTLVGLKDAAATTIQRTFRGHISRKLFSSTFKLQRSVIRKSRDQAARVLQAFFRKYRKSPDAVSALQNTGSEQSVRTSLAFSSATMSRADVLSRSKNTDPEHSLVRLDLKAVYEQQRNIIEKHQRELQELQKLTELKMRELTAALHNLDGLEAIKIGPAVVSGTLPPSTSINNIQLPYDIQPVKGISPAAEPEFEEQEEEVTSFPMTRQNLTEMFALSMTTAEKDYFNIEQKLRKKERP